MGIGAGHIAIMLLISGRVPLTPADTQMHRKGSPTRCLFSAPPAPAHGMRACDAHVVRNWIPRHMHVMHTSPTSRARRARI